ncbi:MAG: permease [Gemmatimonadetes bacterium]|nr:permease [Gemmatimonadota bacterium]
MTHADRHTAARGERLYRALLRLYPPPFRHRYAEDMAEFYRDRVRGEARSAPAAARLWMRLVPDLVMSALAERAAYLADRTRYGSPALDPHLHRPEESMSILQQDVRYALRSMVHRPAFTAVVLATLALGIGANAAIFSVVNAVLLRPLPFAHVERIVAFTHQAPYVQVSEHEFVDYQRDMTSLSKLAAYSTPTATISVGDQPVRASGARVSHDFFDILGTKPSFGRTFARDEFAPASKARVTVISQALWRQQFGADPGVIGKTMQVSGTKFTVIGVMPPGFNFPDATTELWTPWRMNVDSLQTRNNHYMRLVGQLASGATVEQARAQARTLDQRWMRDFPETYFPSQPLTAAITPLRDALLGPTRPYLLALLGAVTFILLIASVNVANLLLVRGESRRKEFAIRAALGASGGRMVRQMLTESMLYALFGAVLGVGLAIVGVRALVSLAPGDVPRMDEVGVDYRVVLFTAAITLATGLLFGLAPAARGLRGDSNETLRDGGKTSAVGASRLARRALVAAEVALAVIMLTGAGLLVRSLVKLQAVDMGFDASRLLTMQLTLPPRGYTDTTADEFFRQLVSRAAHLPGVTAAAADAALPISGSDNGWSIMIDGRVVKTIAEAPVGRPNPVTPDYFRTMSIRILRGRVFTESDRMGAPPVAVINETMAKTLWPGVDPIGRTLKMFNDTAPWVTIVGVVADVRVRGIQADVPSTMYFPYAQSGVAAYSMPRTMSLIVRTSGDPAGITPTVRALVRAANPLVAIAQVATMEQVVGRSIASRTFTTILLVGFAALALALAGIGIYGVIAFSVSQRTYEIGVRMALGASTGSVMRLILGEGVRMTATGLVLGLAGAMVVDRLLRTLLVGVTTTDLPTLAAVTCVLTAVAVCACALPARRATTVSPTEALRAS